jgi:tetratricopeptide (TPR) repeat protein
MVKAAPAFALLLWQIAAPDSSDSFRQALALFNSGKYRECFGAASRYLEQNPGSPAAHKILGMDEYMLGNSREALAEVTRATELAPHDAEAFYYLGRLYFSSDNAVAALAAFQKAVELDGSSVRAYDQLGQTYEVLGRRADAEQAYRKGIDLEKSQTKKSEWPYYHLGLLRLNNGHPADSADYFRQALARNPAFADAKIKLAVVLSNQKPSQQALELLEDATRTDPQNAEGHYRLGLLLTKFGKRKEAQEQFALFEKYRKP